MVKPTPLAWALAFAAPVALLMGVLLLAGGHWLAWPCLVAAAFNAFISWRIIWRWHHAVRVTAADGSTRFTRDTQGAQCESGEVCWGPAHLQQGLSWQRGWAVVRPGWVAFLPAGLTRSTASQLVGAMAPRFTRFALGTLDWDLAGLREAGLQAFDAAVHQGASLVIHSDAGGLGRWSDRLVFRDAAQTAIVARVNPTPALVSSWRAIEVPPARPGQLTAIFAGLSAIPFLIGAVAGLIAATHGAPRAEVWFGVGVWWALAAAVWVGYAVILVKLRRRS